MREIRSVRDTWVLYGNCFVCVPVVLLDIWLSALNEKQSSCSCGRQNARRISMLHAIYSLAERVSFTNEKKKTDLVRTNYLINVPEPLILNCLNVNIISRDYQFHARYLQLYVFGNLLHPIALMLDLFCTLLLQLF